MPPERLILFYDGVCPFCIGWVRFLLDRDGHDRLRFAALQSDWTRRFFQERGLPHPGTGSIRVWDGQHLYDRSEAAGMIARSLPGIWKLAAGLQRLPKSWRDGLYDWIAGRRYQWFGRRDQCWVPGPEVREKFLDL